MKIKSTALAFLAVSIVIILTLMVSAQDYVTPEMFGAYGDGVHDDTDAFLDAVREGYENSCPVVMSDGAVYLMTQPFIINNLSDIEGNNAKLYLDGGDGIEFFIRLDGAHDAEIDNLNIEIAPETAQRTAVGLFYCDNITFSGCSFISDMTESGESSCHCVFDLYSANTNITISGCTFYQCCGGKEGGVWIRNFSDSKVSSGIHVTNCEFFNAGGDEVLAVWGWKGKLEDIVIDHCTFLDAEGEKYKNSHNPDLLITLGNTGSADIEFSDCSISTSKAGSVFYMDVDKGCTNRAVVKNCTVDYSTQGRDSPAAALSSGSADAMLSFENCTFNIDTDKGYAAFAVYSFRECIFNIKAKRGFSYCRELVSCTINGEFEDTVFGSCTNISDCRIVCTSGTSKWCYQTELDESNYSSVTVESSTVVYQHGTGGRVVCIYNGTRVGNYGKVPNGAEVTFLCIPDFTYRVFRVNGNVTAKTVYRLSGKDVYYISAEFLPERLFPSVMKQR